MLLGSIMVCLSHKISDTLHMLHIVHLVERRFGPRARPLLIALVAASACTLLAGLALALR